MTRLSVNINKIATIRNARGGNAPAGPSSAILQQRLERRERRMNPKNIYADGRDRIQLVIGYGDVIKEGREAKGMDVEKFAASIGEKKGIIAKVEAEDLTPDDKLIKKIEYCHCFSLRIFLFIFFCDLF